ncbi:hypothetical protein FH972_023426 [Carpinus fangiana]|uniref:Mediator of RNA polymerase II transcription subunit 7 n=1 Tax=Carpinus fangiana TaxID=176857 RepID=A0A5N6KVN5_9ROSI|nr:hypothetical protein FH972_023426 [Carpinus fangiana]
MADDQQENVLSAAFPAPPPFFKHFTPDNVKRVEAARAAASQNGDTSPSSIDAAIRKDSDLPSELHFLLPPEPPQSDEYRSFGETFNVPPPPPPPLSKADRRLTSATAHKPPPPTTPCRLHHSPPRPLHPPHNPAHRDPPHSPAPHPLHHARLPRDRLAALDKPAVRGAEAARSRDTVQRRAHPRQRVPPAPGARDAHRDDGAAHRDGAQRD